MSNRQRTSFNRDELLEPINVKFRLYESSKQSFKKMIRQALEKHAKGRSYIGLLL